MNEINNLLTIENVTRFQEKCATLPGFPGVFSNLPPLKLSSLKTAPSKIFLGTVSASIVEPKLIPGINLSGKNVKLLTSLRGGVVKWGPLGSIFAAYKVSKQGIGKKIWNEHLKDILFGEEEETVKKKEIEQKYEQLKQNTASPMKDSSAPPHMKLLILKF